MKPVRKALALLLALILAAGLAACASPAGPQDSGQETAPDADPPAQTQGAGAPDLSTEPAESMELAYATQFSVDYYDGGYKLITLADGSRFLVVPEGGVLPESMDSGIAPLYQPLENIYLATSTAMSLFDAMERIDAITLSATEEDGWHIENAKLAMQEGRITFAGKYSEPDYELLLERGCPLAIESMMISGDSDVMAKLKELGIAVLVDQSNLEKHPLGRTEWIRLYGALLNEEDKADEVFRQQVETLQSVQDSEATGTTAAFFHINSSGSVVARNSGDYISKMIELAGGDYVFDSLGDPESSSSTSTMEMESFFAAAKDADVIFYNSSMGGQLESVDDLLAKNGLLAEFKAVQDGNVWCTAPNLYQDTTNLGQMVQSFHTIFSGEADGLDELPFFTRLR